MREGTYSGEDRDGEPLSLRITREGERYVGLLQLGGRELFVWLSPQGDGVTGAVMVPGEGTSWLLSASPFGEGLCVELGGSSYLLDWVAEYSL